MADATKTERPDIVTDDHLCYLDDLRESAVTNMFGASSYIEQEFGESSKDARIILKYWMNSFGERDTD